MKNIYEKINQQVLEGLEKKGMRWFMPWKSGKALQPMNYATGKYYRGFNPFMLNFVMEDREYQHNQWMTYKQAQDKGGQVKTGEKSSVVYFYKVSYKDNKTGKYHNEPTEDSEQVFALRYYNVFNIAQIEGLEPLKLEAEPKGDNERIQEAQDVCDKYLKKQKIMLKEEAYKNMFEGGGRAYYNIKKDFIGMPLLESFEDSDSYYKTLFHEMAHSTGHESRLDRKGITEFQAWGDDTYAREELVAEISAMYLSGLIGLNPHDSVMNSQAYIKGWCEELKDKPRECVYAMSQATKAVDFILG